MLFLGEVKTRPLFARVAKDNAGSIRVLHKCGFVVIDEDRGFANARDEHIAELVLRLDATDPPR
jgi:RimJ/RimL family protein N-acetyltransferase